MMMVMMMTPCAEFFVDLKEAEPALRAVDKVARHWRGWGAWDEEDASTAGEVVMSELRIVKGIPWTMFIVRIIAVVAGDKMTMSPQNRTSSGGGDSLAIHFTFGRFAMHYVGTMFELTSFRTFSTGS